MVRLEPSAAVLASLLVLLAAGQVVPTDPSFDCTNPNYRVIYTACSAGDYSNCCAVGTDCCAGGCCDLLSVCVGVGTSQEMCCDYSDATHCGLGPANPQPSVICTGADGLSSYKCPPDSTCNDHNDSCYLPNNAASSQAPVISPSSSPTRTLPRPAPVKSTTSPVEPTDTASPTTTSSGPSVSVSLVTVSVSPSPTTTKSVATLERTYSLSLGVVLLGLVAVAMMF